MNNGDIHQIELFGITGENKTENDYADFNLFWCESDILSCGKFLERGNLICKSVLYKKCVV